MLTTAGHSNQVDTACLLATAGHSNQVDNSSACKHRSCMIVAAAWNLCWCLVLAVLACGGGSQLWELHSSFRLSRVWKSPYVEVHASSNLHTSTFGVSTWSASIWTLNFILIESGCISCTSQLIRSLEASNPPIALDTSLQEGHSFWSCVSPFSLDQSFAATKTRKISSKVSLPTSCGCRGPCLRRGQAGERFRLRSLHI